MDNTLLVSKQLEFPHLMRIAEGMSYKHEEVVIKARGKQVQRAVEVATMMQMRSRGTIVKTELSVQEMDKKVPAIEIYITV